MSVSTLAGPSLTFHKTKSIFLFMKTKAPPLLPFFRSETQARILAALFLREDEGMSLADLSRFTGSASPTVHHEVERLEAAGVVTSTRVGNVRLVRPNRDLPYFEELHALLLKTYGPVALLSHALSDVDGIEEAYIFGSWARRYEGETGAFPGDIDLLVVGEPNPDAVYEACRVAEEQLRSAVNSTILTPAEWKRPRTGFVKTVKKGPKVALLGDKG